MHECASAESWPAAVSRAWRLQGQIDRALAWSDSQHGVRPASHRGLTLNSAQKGAKASRLNCRSAAVPHESDGARELRMALSGCVNRSSEPAASRKRSFRLPQTHRAKRRAQPANPERRRYLRADSFSGSQEIEVSRPVAVKEILPFTAAKTDVIADRFEHPHQLLIAVAAVQLKAIAFVAREQCR